MSNDNSCVGFIMNERKRKSILKQASLNCTWLHYSQELFKTLIVSSFFVFLFLFSSLFALKARWHLFIVSLAKEENEWNKLCSTLACVVGGWEKRMERNVSMSWMKIFFSLTKSLCRLKMFFLSSKSFTSIKVRREVCK